MKKLMIFLLLTILCACTPVENNEEVIIDPPTSQQVGNVCTLVTSFDEDVYNVTLYYQPNNVYPMQNEDDLNKIHDIGLKYSSSGNLDVQKYIVNQEKALSKCNMKANAKVIESAIQISKEDYSSFINELKNYKFSIEVIKENQTFNVNKNNTVVETNYMEMNYKLVHSLDFSDQLLSELEKIKYPQTQVMLDYDPSRDEVEDFYGVSVSVFYNEHVDDGHQAINPSGKLEKIGESYMIIACCTKPNEYATIDFPIFSLVVLSKDDINDTTYVDLNENVLTKDLLNYAIYEDESIIVLDINKYLYEYEDFLSYMESYLGYDESWSTIEPWKLDEEALLEFYYQINDQVVNTVSHINDMEE